MKDLHLHARPPPLGERDVMSSQDLQEDVMNLNLKYIEKMEAILPCCGELSVNSFHLGEPYYELIQSNLLRI